MELICDQCGSIGIYFPRRMAEDEIRRHVEGDGVGVFLGGGHQITGRVVSGTTLTTWPGCGG